MKELLDTMVSKVIFIASLMVYVLHISEGNPCSLETPAVFVHSIYSLSPSNTTREKEELWRLMDEVSCVPSNTCCSCSNDTYFCSSMADIKTLVLPSTPDHSLFVGVLTNATTLDEVMRFDSWNFVVITSMVAAVEYAPSSIVCSTNVPSGFVFRNIHLVSIENIEINNCGEKHTGDHFTKGGAVVLENNTITEIIQVVFIGSIGSAIMLNNSLVNQDAELRVVGSRFQDNSIDNMPIYGGGVGIYSTSAAGPTHNLVINITDCIFYNNQASYGGSIALIENSEKSSRNTYLRVKNSNFTDNTAFEDGGAFYQLGLVDSIFKNCLFLNNVALHSGGAIAIYGQNPFQLQSVQLMVLDSCEFRFNSASGYAVLYVSLPLLPMENEKLTFQLRSVIVANNYLSPEVFDSDNCVMFFTNINVLMSNGVTLQYNKGSVVCLNNAYLHFENEVQFVRNFGYRGGAVNMQGLSLIHIHENATVDFKQNSAVYGGAIYKSGDSKRLYENKNIHECTVFNFLNNSSESYAINFVQNSAKLGGLALYVVNSGRNSSCELELQSTAEKVLNLAENPNAIETSNLDIDFKVHNENMLSISLGIYLTLNTEIRGFNQSSALFYVTLFKDGEEYVNTSNSGIHIVGPTALSLSQGLTFTNFFFLGPEVIGGKANNEYSNFSLTFFLAENFNTNATINLNFIPCKLGFEYSNNEKKCVCVESSHLLCSERQNLACIERGFWYGEEGVVIPCYSGFCKNSYDNCTSCELESGGGEYCTLQLLEEDECIDDRAGRACIFCRTNYSYTYGAQKCIEDSNCNLAKDIPIIVFTSIIFLLLIMFFMYGMLKIDSNKHFGYFYVVCYYYTVIGFVLPNSIISNSAQTIIDSLIKSFVTLNPIFLGQVDVCFNKTHLEITLLNFVFPIVVSILIAFQIKLSQKFPKYFNYKDNVLIRGICVMTLLSFGAILEASFNIINPVRYNNHTYVSIQPDILYLGGNILYIFSWLIAMIFMLVFIIPLTIFLLFSPLIMRCFSIMKFRPFLDQFHACYKEKYRWMSGFYFLCRLVYFAIIIDPATTEVSSYPYIRYASVTILIIHCLLQPYKTKLLNISDAIILADIALLSLIHNSQDAVIVGDVTISDIRAPVTYILLNIPVLYLLALIIGFSFLRIKKFRLIVSWLKERVEHYSTVCLDKVRRSADRQSNRRSGWERQIDESLELDLSISADFTRVNDAAWFTEPREPLLSSSNADNIRYTNLESSTEIPLSEPAADNKVTLVKPKPRFSEMTGDGLISSGKRKGSFLVQYMKYREDSLNPNEVTEVTGESDSLSGIN